MSKRVPEREYSIGTISRAELIDSISYIGNEENYDKEYKAVEAMSNKDIETIADKVAYYIWESDFIWDIFKERIRKKVMELESGGKL